MTSRLNFTAPATLTVLAGNGALSSLGARSPGGIFVADPDAGGTLSVQIVAGTAGAALSASAGAGATVTSNGNTLSLTGTALEVNAALDSLELVEPAAATRDVLTLTAADPAVLPGRTNILVDVGSAIGPAFVAPALITTLRPDAPDLLPDLLLSDPAAGALAAMGLGTEETLNLTLAVAAGVLLLPGFTDAGAISASGLGTGTIQLSFTADQIGALNGLLAGLEFVGPAGEEQFYYTLRNVSGVLPAALTYGNIYLNVAGAAGTPGTIAAGSQTLLLGDQTLGGTLGVSATASVLGNVSGAVMVAPDANLELPYHALSLNGTSFDYGSLAAATLISAGTLVAAGGASFAAAASMGAGALLDFAGQLVAGGGAQDNNELALSLAAGAVVTGNGTLLAGNFSESGLIEGPGTLLALAGEMLTVSAGSVGGGAALEVDPGGVMVLGPVTPLLGIFDATPLTIDSSVTLSFLGGAGGAAVAGGYAARLGGDGGAFVINGPQAFSGTVIGFQPGDQLIFSGLSDFSLSDETPGSFAVAGQDDTGAAVSYEIDCAIPAGTALVAGLDAEGDPDVVLSPAVATITQAAALAASAGIAQPLQGLSLAVPAADTQSLSLILSCQFGQLSDGTLGPAGQITLSADGLSQLEVLLAGLTYIGTGVADQLTIAGSSENLAGLLDFVDIAAAGAGPVNGYAGAAFSEAQVASFGSSGGLAQITAPLAAGEILADGTVAFADALQVNGISGTALVVDGGASAIFNAAASVALGGDVTLGDAGGAGTLAIMTGAFSTSGNVTLAGDETAGGSAAYVLGALDLAGTLEVGSAAAGLFDLGGSLAAGATTLGAGGTVLAYDSASAVFGDLGNAGLMVLESGAQAWAADAALSGTLSLGGGATFVVSGGVSMQAGSSLVVGPDALLQAGALLQPVGAIDDAEIWS